MRPWLGREAPRYTSYPTAHHFHADVTPEQHAVWVSTIPAEEAVSLYVHIPFCQQLCWFCGCHTSMTRRYEPVARYVPYLLKEITLLASITERRVRAGSLHFGGGSPTLLTPEDMAAIVDALRHAFAFEASAEIAIEIDPRTVSTEKIATYAVLGFNRASIGIQDFTPEVQQAIGRIQPYVMVKETFRQLRAHGIRHINADLIYGLPFQTGETIRDTLEKTLTLTPSRIALFSYAHVPSIKKHQRLIPEDALPDDEIKLALAALAKEILEESGYVAIGIDHFALPDDPLAIAQRENRMRRNFQGYVTDAAETLLGIGVSSISQFAGGYAQNTTKAEAYRKALDAGRLPTARGWKMQGEDAMRGATIEALMCYLCVDLADVAAHFPRELAELKEMETFGVVRLTGTRVEVAKEHPMAARVVAAVFDQYRHAPAGRYSKVA